MKLNKVNIGAISKFFSSAAVIYGSAFINNTFYAWSCDNHFWNTTGDEKGNVVSALFLAFNQSGFDLASDINTLKYEFAKKALYTIGSYKLVDSVFSFDSIESKAATAGFAGALSGLFDCLFSIEFNRNPSKALTILLYYKLSLVNILCKAAAASALTYINSEGQPDVELVTTHHYEDIDPKYFCQV